MKNTNITFLKWLFFFSLNANALFSFGYNKTNHEHITRLAIKLLNQECQYTFINEKEAEAIIAGNISEDHFGFKWLNRLWNQHFYNPRKPEDKWERIHSIDVRFERIAKRCFERIGTSSYYYSIGEVIHHIQDVTNPAHVVPVYHGGYKKDQFDEQDILQYNLKVDDLDTNKKYNAPYLLSILKPIALTTLDGINEQFQVKVKVNGQVLSRLIDWSYFWKEDSNTWFGYYGLLGAPSDSKGERTDNYMSSEIVRKDSTYIMDKKTYTDYSSQQIKLAIVETAKFIYYAKCKDKKNPRRDQK